MHRGPSGISMGERGFIFFGRKVSARENVSMNFLVVV